MERVGLAPGTEIGGYTVLGPVGSGGMGSVYRAQDADGAQVALKLLHPHLTDGPARERLAREVAVLQRVRHPGVARVLDAEIDSAEAFVVTELVDGIDLAAHVAQHGPLVAGDLADLAAALRDAIVAVHAAGVLHRDVSPANVIVTADGPVLIDFGIAQAEDDARVTRAGHVTGTPGYLCPEALEGAEPSTSADWWGWAAVLAFAATGRPPFGVRPIAAVLARVRAGEADLADLDPHIARLMAAAFAVDPAQRLDPEVLTSALRDIADGRPGPAAEPWGETTALAYDEDAQPPEPDLVNADETVAVPVPVPVPDPVPVASDGEWRPEWAAEPSSDWLAAAWVPEEHEPAPRTGLVLAVGGVLVAIGGSWPLAAFGAAIVLAVLVRSVGLDALAVMARRASRGPRRTDTARAVLAWPWYLLRALLGTVPAVVVGVSAALAVGGMVWWLLDSGSLPAPSGTGSVLFARAAPWVDHATLAMASAAGLAGLWFGPISRVTRVGARYVANVAVPPGALAVLLGAALVATAAMLAYLYLDGAPIGWWPLAELPRFR